MVTEPALVVQVAFEKRDAVPPLTVSGILKLASTGAGFPAASCVCRVTAGEQAFCAAVTGALGNRSWVGVRSTRPSACITVRPRPKTVMVTVPDEVAVLLK